MYKILFIESNDYLYSMYGAVPYSVYELSGHKKVMALHIKSESKEMLMSLTGTVRSINGKVVSLKKDPELFEIVEVKE